MSHAAELLRFVLRLFISAFRLPLNVASHLLRRIPGTRATSMTITPYLKDKPCRFRLDSDSSDIITLPDGRKFGYAQYGSLSPTAKVIFYLHGLPGSRIEGTWFEDLGREMGARIIAPERPGYGLSSPQLDRKLLDFPKDLEFLANHLGVEEYAVLGVSGGGPYALACAAGSSPEKLKCATLVCGMGPQDIGMKGADLTHKLGYPYGFRLTPRFLNRLFWRMDPTGRLELTDEERLDLLLKPSRFKGMDEKDVRIFKDIDILRVMLRGSREAFAQGYEHVRLDGKLICEDFGFRVQDIRADLPVRLWYGKQDVYVPLIHGEQIAARLGGRAHLNVQDHTHASIFLDNRREVLADILNVMHGSKL